MTVGTGSDSTQPRASSPTTRRSTWPWIGSKEPTTHATDAMPTEYNVRLARAHGPLCRACVAELAFARAQTLRLCAALDETNRSR